MKIVTDYNDYFQLIKDLPSNLCTYDELHNHIIHRSEAALTLFYKHGILDKNTGKNMILFLSIDSQLEIYQIKYGSSEGKSEQGGIIISVLDVPPALLEIYAKLGKLYNEPRTPKWWKLCFARLTETPTAKIFYDDSYGELFVNDKEELCFQELIDNCSSALSSHQAIMSGQEDVLILADDERLLPLEFVLQKHTNTSRIVIESSFNECSDDLISEFRKNYCKPSLSHKICLVSSDGRFDYLDSEYTQIVYIPCNTDIASLSLTSKLSLTHLIDNQTPNIEISGIKYICCSLFSTTDVFGHTLVALNLSDKEGKTAIIFSNGEVITNSSMQRSKDVDTLSTQTTIAGVENSVPKSANEQNFKIVKQ